MNLYLLKDDFEKAKQWADRIAKVNPNDQTLKAMQKQIDQRDSGETKKMLGKAGKPTADDKRAQAWKNWRSGKPDKAVSLFKELIKEDPRDANALNGLGWSLFNSGKAKEAHEAFIECLKVSPKEGAALNGAGQTALALHDWPKAEEYLQKGSDEYLKQIPEEKINAQNLPAAWYGLVRVHMVQGNFDKAIEWAERISSTMSATKK